MNGRYGGPRPAAGKLELVVGGSLWVQWGERRTLLGSTRMAQRLICVDDPSQVNEETMPLVLAMPRRELYRVQGYQTQVDFKVIESIADEQWFAEPRALAEDLEAKEVRLGLLIRIDDRYLLSEHGDLVHVLRVPAAVVELGEGLRALRTYARLAAGRLLDRSCREPVLRGYVNDDGLAELRPCFVLIYAVAVPEATQAPAGCSWVPSAALAQVPMTPLSSLVLAGEAPA